MRFLLAIVFVTMLFIAGCPGDQQGDAQTRGPAAVQPEGTPSTPTGGAEGGAGGETGAQEGGDTGAQAQEGSPFGSWDMQAMMAAGQPVHCTTTDSEDGYTTVSEMWLKGENMRVETSSTFEGNTIESTVVFKNDVSYMSGGMSMAMEEDCDWVTMDSERLEECMPDDGEIASFDMDSYEAEAYDTTPTDYSCDYATFGDEKFDTPGKVCDITEEICTLYESLGEGGFPEGMGGMDASICDGMEGQDYTDCITAISQYG